jgi:hypothetical protein
LINYVNILIANYPGTNWSFNGDTYDGLTWFDETPKPTQAELESQWPQVAYNSQVKLVEKTRHLSYIEISDPIFFEWQRGTNTKEAWEAAVQAIKDANPYPNPIG